MRFFSNDARDASDEEAQIDEHPQRVTSEPVAVPVQRTTAPPSSQSPWGPAAPPVRDPGDGAVRAATAKEPPPFHEPAATPTAFGATTVGGAVAASALANPQDEVNRDGQDEVNRERQDEMGPERQDEVNRERQGEMGPERPGAGRFDPATRADAEDTGMLPPVDGPAVDQRSEGGRAVDGPVAGDRGGSADRRSAPNADEVVDVPLHDGGTFTDPVVADDVVAVPAATDDRRADPMIAAGDRADGARPAEEPVKNAAAAVATERNSTPTPNGHLPGTVPAPELGPLFSDRDAHTFRDRWREVQLQFVDDPKVAADAAATLVDEAVDALAAGLRSQTQQLGATSADDTGGDTERLRVLLRSYRDFLDRLLGL